VCTVISSLAKLVNLKIILNYYPHKAKKMKWKTNKDALLEASGDRSRTITSNQYLVNTEVCFPCIPAKFFKQT